MCATFAAFALVVTFFAILPFVNRINIRRSIQSGGDLSAFATSPVRPVEAYTSPTVGRVDPEAHTGTSIATLAAEPEELKMPMPASESLLLLPARLEQEAKRAFEFDVADLDFTPMPIHRVTPDYPFALKQQGIEGRAFVEFRVDPQGRVIDVRVVETTHPDFGRSVLEAVSRWRFVPGMVSGDVVRFRMRLPVNFRLIDTAGSASAQPIMTHDAPPRASR